MREVNADGEQVLKSQGPSNLACTVCEHVWLASTVGLRTVMAGFAACEANSMAGSCHESLEGLFRACLLKFQCHACCIFMACCVCACAQRVLMQLY